MDILSPILQQAALQGQQSAHEAPRSEKGAENALGQKAAARAVATQHTQAVKQSNPVLPQPLLSSEAAVAAASSPDDSEQAQAVSAPLPNEEVPVPLSPETFKIPEKEEESTTDVSA